jgi:hypothetical protein
VRLRSRDLNFASLPTSYLSEARPLLGTDRFLDWVGWKRFQVRVVCSTVCATMALNIENGGSGGEFVSWSHHQSLSAASVLYNTYKGDRGADCGASSALNFWGPGASRAGFSGSSAPLVLLDQ